MKISGLCSLNNNYKNDSCKSKMKNLHSNIAFERCNVTLARAYGGDLIAEKVVAHFNQHLFPKIVKDGFDSIGKIIEPSSSTDIIKTQQDPY